MKLISFVSDTELLNIGLLAGEPTKGPLLKTLELLKPESLLAIAESKDESSIEQLKNYLPVGCNLNIIHLGGDGQVKGMNTLLHGLITQAEKLQPYKDAVILNYGTPQQRAALWVLKHECILTGNMVEPPQDYIFAQPAKNRPILVAAEPQNPFYDDDTPPQSSLWDNERWGQVAEEVGCVGNNPRFRKTLEEAAMLSGHPTPILLMGETGSGKEVLARFIHALSPRANKIMVSVNCAALPETLAESILFGHEKGAFTGAYKQQKGKFEQADGGTLFLDELGELSLANQAKLLRVLETRSVDMLGGGKPIPVDVRVIAATNRNLQQDVACGRFREDLYYRLRAGEIDIPALRERASDIPLIALRILARCNTILAHPKQFSKNALKFLEAQRWPGNVRDLINTIERAALLCSRTVIEPEDFRINGEKASNSNGSGLPTPHVGFSLEDYIYKIRQELYEKALQMTQGNRSEAAKLLGITPQAIHKYLKTKTQEASKET